MTNYPTYDKKNYALVQRVKKWKHFLFGEGDHYPYRPSTIAVLIVTVKVAAITTLQMDGFSTIVSFSYKIQKGNLQ